MKNKYSKIFKGICVLAILILMGCPAEIPVDTTVSPLPSVTPTPLSTSTPYISTTNIRGKILLPAGFQYYPGVTNEKGKGFIVEAYNYNGQLYGRVGANEDGEYTFVSMPVGIRMTFQAIYTRTSNVTLRAVADIPSTQAGKETQTNINTRTTAVSLIIADSQAKNSNISKMPVGNFDIVPDFSNAVTKVENQIVNALAKPVTQILTPVTANTTVLDEVKNAEVTISITLNQKPEWGTPPVGIMLGDSSPIISPTATSGTTPTPSSSTSSVVSSITLSPGPSVVIANNSNIQFTVTAYNSSGQTVTVSPMWTSSNTSVGSISINGLFQSYNAGSTIITATVGSFTTSTTVTVTSSTISSLTISPTSITIGIGGTLQFYAYGRDSSGNSVSITPVWIVANSNIGTIDNQGRFTGTSNGSTTITAISGTLTQTANVTVGSGGYSLTITNVSPSAAVPGSTVTIYGNYFDASSTGNNNVYFNGTRATVIYASSTSLTVSVPYGATSGYIQVSTPYGSGVSPSTFTIL